MGLGLGEEIKTTLSPNTSHQSISGPTGAGVSFYNSITALSMHAAAVCTCMCVCVCVCLCIPGQGHSADGEVGGGDGPQTSHGGVSSAPLT